MSMMKIVGRGGRIKMELKNIMSMINLLSSAFFGIGFIYSPSKLFQYLGGLFVVWACVYTCYCRCRGGKK